uniref:C2H2-type domain-containing protein n=1 Tax=Spongospora subterranea TaxID=70186 RepID=A0A0H5QKC9_9EUKA|eukprot:CRZ02076.1 hypothetical protein [Spongospora subterranea]
MDEWPDSTDVREFFSSHVQSETRLEADRLDAIVQSLLNEGLGTFGVLRAIIREFANDDNMSPAKVLQRCVEPPLPLGVCYVLAKYLQSQKPNLNQLSAMSLLVQATKANGIPESSSDEEDFLDDGRSGSMSRGSGTMKPAKAINVVTAKIEPSQNMQSKVVGQTTSIRHSGTHACPYCPKRFQYCHLQDHIRSHTGEKPFRCPHCKKFFSRNSTMRRHVKRLHKMPPPASQHVPPHIPSFVQ